MKITYVIDSLDYLSGGTERQLYFLIQGMVLRGHTVELYLLRETNFTRTLNEFPCPIYCLGIGSLVSMTALRRLWSFRKSLIASNVDVVHGFFNDVALIIPPLLMLTGITALTSRRDMGIWYSRSRLFLLRLFRFTKTRLICNSLAVAELTRKREWKSMDAIKVIHNGIRPVARSSGYSEFAWTAKRGRETSEVVNVVLVANIGPIKRIEDLIRAAGRLQNGQNRFQFYIVGKIEDDIYYRSLEELLRDQCLEGVVHFVGPVEDPRSGLGHFDIGVLTSESEGLSNAIMEYLAAGLPVVASRVGGNPEVVSNGYNGYLYKVGNVHELVECLGRLASDPGLRLRMAENAKKSIKQFDSCSMIERHEKLYMSI